MHASGDMAFYKDFELLERTARQANSKLYPDIIGGAGEERGSAGEEGREEWEGR